MDPLETISSFLFKGVFKAVSWYVDRTVWIGYFVQTSNCCNSVSEEDSKTIALYLYKKSSLNIIDNIKYELKGLNYDNSIIRLYIESFVEIIKEKEPLIYLLYNIDNLSFAIEDLKEDIKNIVGDLKNSVKFECLSIDDVDLRLKQMSLSQDREINLEFFNFNDYSITSELDKHLEDKEKRDIMISGNYAEETFYALLYQLKNKYKDDYLSKVVVVESINVLNKIGDLFPEDTIIVFNTSYAEEDVVRYKKYINIHIVSKDEEHDIYFRNRLSDSTRKGLEKCGFKNEEIDEILIKCGNNYPLYKSHILNVTSKYLVKVLKSIPRKDIGFLLLIPKWSLSTQKDKKLISSFVNKSVDDYLDEIMPKDLEESPFVKTISSMYSRTSVRVLSYKDETIFYQLKGNIQRASLNNFFQIAKTVLEDIPSNYLDTNNIYTFSNEKCSEDIREGIVHTLIMLSIYCDDSIRSKVQNLLKELIKYIRSKNDLSHYRYLSNLLPKIVEACPRIVLNTIKEDLNDKHGLYYLFEKENTGRNLFSEISDYQNVLQTLRLLLFVDEFKLDSIRLLLKLGLNSFPGNKNKYINELITNSMLACIKMVPLDIKEKKELLQWMFNVDRDYAYQLCLELQYEHHRTVLHTNGPTYLHYRSFDNKVAYAEMVDLYTFYASTAVKNAQTAKELSELINKNVAIHYGEDFLKESLKSIIEKTNLFKDDLLEKDVVASAIRSFIHKNRHYADANWSVPESIIEVFESSLNKIKYEHPESKYVHLFCPSSVCEPNPLPYNSESYDYYAEQENKRNYIKKCSHEFLDNGLSLEYLISLINLMSKNNPSIPSEDFVYLYQKCNSSLDEESMYLNLIHDVSENSTIVEYIGNTIVNKDKKLFFAIANKLKKNGNDIKLIKFLMLYPIDKSDIEYISFINKTLTKKQRNMYFKAIPEHIHFANNIETLSFILGGIKNAKFLKNESNKYVSFIYYYFLRTKNNDEIPILFDLFASISDKLLSKTSSPGEAVELVKHFQQYYMGTNDERIIKSMAFLEMKCGFCNEYQKPVFLLNYLASHPDDYYWFIKPLFFATEEEKKTKGREKLYSFVTFGLLFCPGYSNNIFDEFIFSNWVKTFEKLILDNGDNHENKRLLYHLLGKLFGYSISDATDSIKPPIRIREFIETVPDDYFDEFSSSYRMTISNSIGVRTIGDGSDLVKKSNDYKKDALELERKGFIKTAKILNKLSQTFEEDGKVEREEAEGK